MARAAELLHHCAGIAPPRGPGQGTGGPATSHTTMSTVIQTDDRVVTALTDKRPLVSVVLPAFILIFSWGGAPHA